MQGSSAGSLCKQGVSAVQLYPLLGVDGLFSPSAAFPENMLYRCTIWSTVNILENCSTILNHCLLDGFCFKKDVHVLIHVPFTKPENAPGLCQV